MAGQPGLAGCRSLRPTLITAVADSGKVRPSANLVSPPPAPARAFAPVQHVTEQSDPDRSSNDWLLLSSHARAVRVVPPALALMLIFSGCAVWKHVKPHSPAAPAAQGGGEAQTEADAESEAAEAPAAEAPPAAPAVTVHISYAHRDDYVASMTVAKFASAALIPTRAQKDGSALVRLEGGEPVWQIGADRGVSGTLLGHVPGVAENRKFAIKEVTYGVLPKNFAKWEPENSEPEPLERGKYYIFTVTFGSGSISYQVAHITADGTIEDYEAQPRIGTSYEMCCNIAPDFASPGSSGPDSGEDQSTAP